MPIYNNPAVGQSMENLAKLFGPPSGSDLAGYAASAAKRAENERLSWLFSHPNDPNAANIASLLGVQNYGATAEGFGKTDATNRFKITEDNLNAVKRQQMVNDTAISTNAADNTRALATNSADNSRAFAQTVFGPVAKDAILPAIPADVASLYNVPKRGIVSGNIGASQGETVFGADGKTYQGQAKPLTDAELKAQIMSGRPANEQRAFALGSTPVQENIDPANPIGHSTAFVADSIGKSAYDKPTNASIEYGTGTLPDGTQVPVTASNGKWATQDGKPIPAGMTVTKMAAPTGSNSDLNIKTTEAQDRSAYAASMANDATASILNAFDTGKLPNQTDYQIFNAMRSLPLAAAPVLVQSMSPEGQLFYQNMRTALPYQLMSQSGQAVTEQEYTRKLLELMPVPGEAPQVTAAKRHQFEIYIATAKGVSGPAFNKIQANEANLGVGTGTPVPPQTGMSGGIPASSMPNDPTEAARAEAQAAIAKGANREAVLKRLQDNKISTEGL